MSAWEKKWSPTRTCLPFVIAGVLLLSTIACVGPKIRAIQDTFDAALARGDLSQAEAALFRLTSRRVDVASRRFQLDKARSIEALFMQGEREITGEKFAEVPATWLALNQAAAEWEGHLAFPDSRMQQSRHPQGTGLTVSPWNQGYFRLLEEELKSFRKRWDAGLKKYSARVGADFDAAIAGKRWKEAESQIGLLRAVGQPVSEEERRLERAKAIEQHLADFERNLADNDHDKADSALSALENLGVDVHVQRKTWRKHYLAACRKDFDDAVAARDYQKAETFYPIFQRFGENVDALGEKIRLQKSRDLEAEFDGRMKEGDFDQAEALLARLEWLSASTDAFRERIRQGRIAAIRRGLDEDWERKDYLSVSDKCRQLRILGDDTSDIAEQYRTAFRENSKAFLLLLDERLGDSVPEPDFGEARKDVADFEKAWTTGFDSVFGDIGSSKRNAVLTEFEDMISMPRHRLLMREKAYHLRDRASVGLVDQGRLTQYWVRCTPNLLQGNADYWVDDLNVQLLGYAMNAHREEGKGSTYQITGMDGGIVDVVTGFPPPLEGELVYFLGTVELEDGRFRRLSEHHAAYRPARQIGEERDGIIIPSRHDVKRWVNFDYDFTLENLFRRFVCVKGRNALPPLSEGDWSEGARTSVSEAESYFRTHE